MQVYQKYGLFVILLLVFHTAGYSQNTAFFQKLTDNIVIDSVVGIARSRTCEIAILGYDRSGNQILHLDYFGSGMSYDLEDRYKALCYGKQDSVILVDQKDQTYFYDREATKAIPIPNTLPSHKNTINTTADNWYSADGYLSTSNLIHNAYEGVTYTYQNQSIYTYAEDINTYFEYHTIPVAQATNTRLAKKIDGQKWIVALEGRDGLYLYEEGKSTNILKLPINSDIAQTGILFFHAAVAYGHVYFSGNDFRIYRLDLDDLSITPITERPSEKFKNIIVDSKGRLYCGSTEGDIFYINKEEKLIKKINAAVSGNINTYRHYEDQNGWHWWGFSNGLSVYLPDEDQAFHLTGSEDHFVHIKAVSAFANHHEALYFGTYGSGMYKLNYLDLVSKIKEAVHTNTLLKWEDIVMEKVSSALTDETSSIQYMVPLEDGILVRTRHRLWLLNDRGLSRITPNEGFLNDIANFFSSKSEGGVVNDIKNGFSIFYPDRYFAQKTKSSLDLQYAVVGQDVVSDLKYEDNRIHLGTLDEYYAFLQLKISSQVNQGYNTAISYSVDGQPWKSIVGDNLIITQNGIGDHVIDIRSVTENDQVSPLRITYHVTQRWHNSLWFRLLILTLLGFTIAYFWRLYHQRKKLEKSLKMMETESLRSYMNPHFISNSLNSINYYILQNERDTASTYIIKFSKLIRRILSNSENEYISIQEEIESLTNYIEIEQMRFEGKFDYEIAIDDNVNTHDLIASFVLQPIVENAIWHGLVQKVGKGHLSIHFKRQNEGYLVTIIDDGIGIEAANEIKSKTATKRKSYGMKMVDKRLHLLNDIYGYHHVIHTKSLRKSENENGTEVSIFLNIHKEGRK